MELTYSRQERESASDEVFEVASNVLRLQLPVGIPGVGHVNCYALYDSDGVVLVDPGLPGDLSWSALLARLDSAGIPLKRIHGVVVTHSHLDHYGGCVQLLEETKATLFAHRLFSARRANSFFGAACGCCGVAEACGVGGHTSNAEHDFEDSPAVERLADSYATHDASQPNRTPWGPSSYSHPRESVKQWVEDNESDTAKRFPGRFYAPKPARRVDDGEILRLAGREWLVVHTPGHTVDHICLWDSVEDVLLAGDHVLPTITPHILGMVGGFDSGGDFNAGGGFDSGDGSAENSSRDLLASFLVALERVGRLGEATICLPGHGHPFSELSERVRTIRGHHVDRLNVLRGESSGLTDAPVEAFMQVLYKPKVWGYSAASETLAHLEYLRCSGEAEMRRDQKGLLRYSLRGGAGKTSHASQVFTD
ncbi:MAG: MBL fold metallo-hydrolase [Acidimicrobiaceae bacterium]|nr:MBL fold metallo-hydrolase [Acidimicrobiaceae bacterium]